MRSTLKTKAKQRPVGRRRSLFSDSKQPNSIVASWPGILKFRRPAFSERGLMRSERSKRSRFAGSEALGFVIEFVRRIPKKRELFSAAGSIMPPAGRPAIARCCDGAISGREAQLH